MHRADAAGGEQVGHVVLAGRLEIDQDRRFVGQRVEALERHRGADAAGDGGEMDQRIGRAADRQQHAQRVLDRLRGDDPGRPQIGADHRHRPAPARLGGAQAVGVDRGNGRGAGQRHAQRLGDRGHGAGGAHHRAASGGGREIALDVVDLVGRRPPWRGTSPRSAGSRCRRRGARHGSPSAASGRRRAAPPARRRRPLPSAAPAPSCRSRRPARPRPSAGRGSFPRRPSP